jgi:membrane protease YdiL (CAAX protease family)
LVLDFILFLLFGGIIWAIDVIGQSSFPGNNFFPFFIRSIISVGLLTLSYYVNCKFSRKNVLNDGILKFNSRFIKQYLNGSILGCLLIATIWAIIYLIYPFEIIKKPYSIIRLATEVISYGLGNTLEELLFRGFLLLAAIKLFGKISGVLFVSLLFGLFHLQGTGFTREGLSMVMTTFTMSLLFISVIYYTKSIWTAVTLHVTGNLLLHTLGFDGASSGMFIIKFATSNVNEYLISLIFEIVVIAFALLVFFQSKKQKADSD